MLCVVCFVGGMLSHAAISVLWASAKAKMVAEVNKLVNPPAPPPAA